MACLLFPTSSPIFSFFVSNIPNNIPSVRKKTQCNKKSQFFLSNPFFSKNNPFAHTNQIEKSFFLADTIFFGVGFRCRILFQTHPKTKQRIIKAESAHNSDLHPKWPPGEDMASRRRRFGKNVVKMTTSARERIKAIQKGKHVSFLRPPDNGLLVQKLIPLAHQVLAHRTKLLENLPLLLQAYPAFACSFCPEIFIGPRGHDIHQCRGSGTHERHGSHLWIPATVADIMPEMEAYHLADRLSRPVPHDFRFEVDRIPAVVEICIQAGVDLPEYPTLRRTKPLKDPLLISRTRDFIPRLLPEHVHSPYPDPFDEFRNDNGDRCLSDSDSDSLSTFGLEETWKASDVGVDLGSANGLNQPKDLRSLAEETMTAWEGLREGVLNLMAKYPVKTCGYCTEVHVGPVGHRVRLCNASKHQWRKGQHGWQEAILDDIVPPKYVWHLRDRNQPDLELALLDFYGMAPSIVELCVQAGAEIPIQYHDVMRLDVVIPDVDEISQVV